MTDVDHEPSERPQPPGQWPEHPGYAPPVDPPFVPPDTLWRRFRDSRRGPQPLYRGAPTDWRRVLVAVVVAIFFVGLLALVAYACTSTPDQEPPQAPEMPQGDAEPDDGQGPDGSTPSIPEPNAPTESVPGTGEGPSAPVTTPAETAGGPFDEAMLDELIDFVEQERGHRFLTRPVVEALEDQAFADRLLEDFEESREEVETTEAVLRALRLLPRSSDLYTLLGQLYGGAVVGFYDSETGELVVRGVEPSPHVRAILVHELTHALDDQIFELYRPELDDVDDESSFGFQAIIEGTAVYIEDRYVGSLSDDERLELAIEEQEIGAGTDYAAFPPFLLDQLVAPYAYGPELVTAIVDEGGRDQLDEAFVTPPTSSEQVLEPDRFLADEPARAPGDPIADGEVIDDGVIGQFGLELMFKNAGLAPDRAAEAASGWGGDRYVAWQTGDRRTCLRTNLVMDNTNDLADVTRALQTWASSHGSASVTTQNDEISFTACG